MNREDRNLMTSGDVRKKILLFALPVFLGNLFQQMYNTADSLIVGRFLGKEALAGVTSTGSLVYLIIGMFNGLAMGAGTVIARHIGAGDDSAVEKDVHTSIALGLLCSVIVSVGGYFVAEPVLRLMGAPENVLPISVKYLSIYFAGSFSVIMYNVFVGILQASGDSKTPLIYLVISSIVNIILDVVFIAVFGMDVAGAAIATVISQTLSAVLAGIRLYRSKGIIRMRLSRIRFEGESLKYILRYGVPTGGQVAVIDLSNVLIQSYINSFGDVAMAGLGAYSKIEGFVFLPITAFQIAIATFISQNIGAKQFKRARSGIYFGVFTSVAVSEAIGLIVFAFSRFFIGAFNSDPEVIRYGMMRANACAPLIILAAYAHSMSAVMRGIGKPMTPMLVMLTCWCAVRVLVLFTIGRIWHVFGLICWIYPITWMLSAIVYTIYAMYLRKEFPWLKKDFIE